MTTLTQSRAFLTKIMDSEFGFKFILNDMIEVFEHYDWQCLTHISEAEKARWQLLLNKGADGLSGDEAVEFLSYTDPDGPHHIALQYYLAKQWLLDTAVERSPCQEVVLSDEDSDEMIRARVITGTGISIEIDGYGVCGLIDGYGSPIFIEYYEGELLVWLHSDINEEDYTHRISLDGARLDRRK